MTSIRNNLNYFVNAQLNSWKTALTYRAEFTVWAIFNLFGILSSYVAVTIVYSVSTGIPGWSYYQILMLAAITSIAIGILYYFMSPWDIVWRLREGRMDMWFTKPYSHLLIILSGFGSTESMATILGGLAVFVYAALNLTLQPANIIAFLVLFAVGNIMLLIFIAMLTMLAYYMLKSANFMNRVIGLAGNAGKYPLPIYGFIGQVFFSLVLPIGIAYYYPAEALFGKISTQNFSIALISAVVITIVSYGLFNVLIKKYTSGGG